MAVKFAAWGNSQFVIPSTGAPASGYLLYTYVAGSSTPVTTYTTSAGNVAQSNPIVLNSAGFPTTGQIWIEEGTQVKIVFTDPSDVVIKTEDNIPGANDASVSQSQWVASGLTPTYVSATSFTLAGDQTTAFHIGRRLKTTNSGGTIYSTISMSAFGALTTVTVINDSGTLDSGLSAVSYSLLTATNTAEPGYLARDSAAALQAVPLRDIAGYISGLLQATNLLASDELFISTGVAVSDTNDYLLRLSTSLFKKRIATSWAVGSNQGGLDTGSISADTWYYIFVIARPDTGVVDALCSLSATAPTMPANYTQRRLIGAYKTTGASVLPNYITTETAGGGMELLWYAPPLDVDLSNTLTTSRRTDTLSVPTAFSVRATVNIFVADASASFSAYVCCPDVSDQAPSITASPLVSVLQPTGVSAISLGGFRVRTSATGTIAARATLATVDTYRVATVGFEWSRR